MREKVTDTNLEVLNKNTFFDSEFIENYKIFFEKKTTIQNLIQLKETSKRNYLNKWKFGIRFRNKLNISIKANNIFCSFSEISNFKNKNIQSASAGMYKIKTTKKRIRYTYIKMISLFIRKIYHKLENSDVEGSEDSDPFACTILNIVSQKKLHKPIIKFFEIYGGTKRNLSHPFFFINIEPKKCFNGCRVSKKRRKKRLKNVVFG